MWLAVGTLAGQMAKGMELDLKLGHGLGIRDSGMAALYNATLLNGPIRSLIVLFQVAGHKGNASIIKCFVASLEF